MKSIITLVLCMSCSMLSGQHSQLDTIYANDRKNVALFFPSPIRQGITGASHFAFTYNREKKQYFGLLQATPGVESNLLAITNDGQVYSYILKYAHKLPKLNYFIGDAASIGNEKPLDKVSVDTSNEVGQKLPSNFLVAYRMEYFKKYAAFLLKRPGVLLKSKREKGMVMRVRKLLYNRSEVYVHLEIENRSGIDFEIDALNIYKISGNKRKKSSFQQIQQEVIYKYNMPSVIKHKQSVNFVYVLPKLTFGTAEQLAVELIELKGARSVHLVYKK